jgi:CheY-like chemotaxis protein
VGSAQNAIRALANYKRVEKVLAQARHETEAANRVKSEFLTQMSHEIRTPMTAILGYADILLEHLHGAEGQAAADSIKRNGQYLLDILDTILDLYKIEAGKLPIEKAPCSPVSVVAEVAALTRARVQKHNLGLKTEFAGSIPETIATDPVRLRQVLVNLVSNAVKFTESGGVRIVTHLQPRPGQPPLLQFDVIDTGIGISEEQLKNIFQPFARADGSDGQWVASTGLGLAISQRLAALLGGSITARSELGEGTTFSLTIDPGPLDQTRLLDYPTEVAIGGHTPLTLVPERLPRLTGRVLVVEDVPDIQRLIAYMLRKAGAEVRLAANGQAAVEMVLSARSTADRDGEPYGVILMDMQMPILDGYQATRQLRLLGYAGPIVALTAHALSQDRQKCLDAGCDDYMAKPIERRTLLETVARHLGRQPVLA